MMYRSSKLHPIKLTWEMGKSGGQRLFNFRQTGPTCYGEHTERHATPAMNTHNGSNIPVRAFQSKCSLHQCVARQLIASSKMVGQMSNVARQPVM